MYVSQIVNGILLPVVLAFMLVLINDKRIMGRHTNSLFYNIVCIALSVTVAILALGSAVLLILGR
jgi:Mn2+/Fe2+ NRAMP family transporter